MTIATTSREAYERVDLSARQAEVLAAIRDLGAATDQEIALHLRWQINRVTPRRGELVELGLVMRFGLTKTPAGRRASVWAPTPVQLSMMLGGGA